MKKHRDRDIVPTTSHKLRIARQTLRRLATLRDDELAHAAGGLRAPSHAGFDGRAIC